MSPTFGHCCWSVEANSILTVDNEFNTRVYLLRRNFKLSSWCCFSQPRSDLGVVRSNDVGDVDFSPLFFL